MSDLSLVSNGEGWLTESKRIWGNTRQRTSAMVITVRAQRETVFTAIAAQSTSTAGTGERFSSLPRVLDWRVTVDSSGSPVMLDFRSVRLAPKRWPHLLLVHADLKTTMTERGWSQARAPLHVGEKGGGDCLRAVSTCPPAPGIPTSPDSLLLSPGVHTLLQEPS